MFSASLIPRYFVPVSSSNPVQDSDNPIFPESFNEQNQVFSLSDESAEGILDPLTIEQVGYTPSGTISARTDTDYNTAY